MEFLVFLLLAFAAMMLVVPSIIRGRLEESPVVTADYFQKSMSELGKSLNIDDPRIQARRESAAMNSVRLVKDLSGIRKNRSRAWGGRGSPRENKSEGMSRAEVRRNRIMAILLIDSLLWGAIALFTGKFWALILFTISSILFALYWLAAFILASSRPHRKYRQWQISSDAGSDERQVRANLR